MAEGTQPASWVGDTVEEFKKLPTWGKFAVVAIAIGVVIFGFYQFQKGKTGTPGITPASPGSAGSLLPTGNLPPTNFPTNPVGTPTPPTPTPTPTPVPAPTGPNQLTLQQLLKGEAFRPFPRPVATPSPPKLTTHVVQPGENLSQIAAKSGIRGGWQSIYQQNIGVIGPNPNLIRPGQRLNLQGLR